MKGRYWIATILLPWLLTLLGASIALAQGSATISNVSADNIADTSAVITWITDQPGNSRVDYGGRTPPVLTESDGTSVTDHAVILTNLTPLTLYYYEVISPNTGGNTTVDNNGGALKTAKLCYVVLRTPEADVPLTEPGSFVQDGFYDHQVCKPH